MHREYWDRFYAGAVDRTVTDEPSAFAWWVHDQHATAADAALPVRLVDIGMGTGRDALWFSGRGYDVLGLDYSPKAVALAERRAAAAGLTAGFDLLDLYDDEQVASMAAALAAPSTTVYARFLVHAIEDLGRANLLALAATVCAGSGRLFLEFRTGKDAEALHVFGEHFRRFLEPSVVVDEVEELGGTVLHREEGHGLAVYGDEDPHVARLVLAWP
jgi:SAM-dependent methyltransferase